MGHGRTVACVLCKRSDETKITGALSTKDQVTAHQNCLLFSAGIYCRDSPEFDDLFGFSVEDVMNEVKRGGKLACSKCKKKGATAGCEVRRCKKSYHYPCAVQEGAKTIEDDDKGKYGLYCFYHYQKTQENNSVNRRASSVSEHQTSEDSNEAGPSKVFCLTCEKTEGNISLESLSNSITILYCDQHAPASHKRYASGDSTAAGPSAYSSDSNSSSSTKHTKRRLSFSDKQEESASKRKAESWNGIITEDSSDDSEPNADIEIFAPIEYDLNESANSQTVPQLISKATKSPSGSPSGNQPEDESKDEDKDDDDDDETDAESVSLLPPVGSSMESQSLSTQTALAAHSPVEVVKRHSEGSSPERSPVHSPVPDQPTAGPSGPQEGSARPAPSPVRSKPCNVTGSPQCTSTASSPDPPETICVSLLSSPSSPAALPTDPEPGIHSTSFWKSCNAAGCTQAIFGDFVNAMNDISSRIQSDRASQEDYDLALRVMEASGKLPELVTKQQKELQRKQLELQKAAAAMKEVVSALRR
ncbi:dentin sialophosphoprotein isoform X2 [Dicentrarchus labrax]|uniref:PHD-type domain-containing protein n=1 Tax=Dicentrarchus labrax TaxID=13489 RepID=A0A8C4NSR0_DICLA|nr:dentin sialophosphoprotein isoform X2 [Dicentrarchus labrax]